MTDGRGEDNRVQRSPIDRKEVTGALERGDLAPFAALMGQQRKES